MLRSLPICRLLIGLYRSVPCVAPSGESYLRRVRKEEILRVIGEGTSETNLEDLRKLKKGELVAVAERRPAGSRLLSKILQS